MFQLLANKDYRICLTFNGTMACGRRTLFLWRNALTLTLCERAPL